jgi:hypothetical protein
MVAITIAVTVVFVKVPITVMVPAVLMFHAPAFSIPVARKELLSIVMWRHPVSPLVGWASPITFVPLIVSLHRIPIAFYPDELWSRSGR